MILSLLIIAITLGGDQSMPELPFLDWGACPFECCTYGKWTATADVPVRPIRDEAAKPRFTVRKGQTVTAITGVVITRRAGKVRVLKAVTLGNRRKVTLEPGEILHTLRSLGEGYELFWYRGRTYADQISGEPTKEPEPDATLHVIEGADWEWWVKIRTNSGRTGWILGNVHFDGADACA